MTTIKTLSLTQPWATLIAIGAKRIETRSWYTPYRGRIAIHAAKGLIKGGRREMIRICYERPFAAALKAAGLSPFTAIDALPYGKVLATATLIDCVPTYRPGIANAPGAPQFVLTRGDRSWAVPPEQPELSFGDYTPGRYAWLLDDVQVLPEPIPAVGHLSLWEWTPPEGVTV